MEQNKKLLPTLAELHHNINDAFKNDQLNLLLNQPPHQKFLKDFPSAMGIKGKYMPIDKVQFLLTRIFGEWHPEVIDYKVLFQSVCVHVRLHYKNPLNGEWKFVDGVGASPIQVDAGKNANDLGAIKTRAVQMALPIAKSAAIKDAADELGTLFGRDLNRKDTILFAGAYGSDMPTEIDELKKEFNAKETLLQAASLEELKDAYNSLDNETKVLLVSIKDQMKAKLAPQSMVTTSNTEFKHELL